MNVFLIVLMVTQVALWVAIVFLCRMFRRIKRKQAALTLEIENRLPGVVLIESERKRQISEEGWTAEHDDREHCHGQLAQAGACYALFDTTMTGYRAGFIKNTWPWNWGWWNPKAKPTDGPNDHRRRNLVKAGALIAAEIDRLSRMEKRRTSNVQRSTSNIERGEDKTGIQHRDTEVQSGREAV